MVDGNKMNEGFITGHVVIEKRLQFRLLWKCRVFVSLSDWNLAYVYPDSRIEL